MRKYSGVLLWILWMISDSYSAPDNPHDITNGRQVYQVIKNDLSLGAYPNDIGVRELLQVKAGANYFPESRFPYACSLRADESQPHECAGTLIAPKWVLTSAQCASQLKSASPTPIVYVGASASNNNADAERIQSVRVIVHENWNGNPIDGYDIALVELETPSSKQALNLAGNGQFLGPKQILTALGWSQPSNVGSEGSVLQVADGREYINNANCKNVWMQLKESMLCAKTNPDASCEGDSGDPLIIADTNGSSNFGPGSPKFDLMVGLLSMIPDGCGEVRNGDTTRPSVFTRVSSFREWIDENMVSERSPQVNTDPPTITHSSPLSAEQVMEGTPASVDAFLTAAKDGDLEIVKREVENGVDIEATSTKLDTALIIAAVKNYPDIAEYLVEKGANLEAKDKQGFTPTLVAAFFGHIELLQFLLDQGGDVEARTKEGATALFYAAERNHLDVVKALLEGGADVDSPFTRTGATPLMIAAERTNFGIVEELIAGGADVNAENGVLKTPLHSAAQGPKNSEVIFALIDAGGDVDGQDQDGHTALHYATWNGRKDNYDALLSRGADEKILTVNGESPLDMLCRCMDTTPSKRTNCNFELCNDDDVNIHAIFG